MQVSSFDFQFDSVHMSCVCTFHLNESLDFNTMISIQSEIVIKQCIHLFKYSDVKKGRNKIKFFIEWSDCFRCQLSLKC